MYFNFFKYQGAGNDFILIDNRNNQALPIIHQPEAIKMLCDRHFGIGADGLMVLQQKEGFDFEMLYFNADGQQGSMCGNGGRCIVAFAKRLEIIKDETNFLAVDGSHYAKISENGEWVSLQMIDVHTIQMDAEAYVLNTGSPHFVQEVKDLDKMDVYQKGGSIRNNETYKSQGINVNFVEDFEDYYFVRTFERGVEDETFACGTGVTAVAMTMAKKKGLTGQIHTALKVKGGMLDVDFKHDGHSFTEVFLNGAANFVFSGSIEI